MTTIAFRDGVMAGDGRLSTADGEILTDTYVKVRRCGKYVVGLAGAARHFEDVWKWYGSGAVRSKRPEGEWEALVYDCNTGMLYVHEIDAESPITLNTEEPHAIGAGCSFARVAMECGKSAVDSLKIAAKFQAGTGGDIHYLECKPKKRKTKPRA